MAPHTHSSLTKNALHTAALNHSTGTLIIVTRMKDLLRSLNDIAQQNPTQPPATAPVTVTMKTIKVIVKTLTQKLKKIISAAKMP